MKAPLRESPLIFIVEDNEEIAGILEHALRREGYRLHVARSGKDALSYLADGTPANLVLLDIMLPYMDGFQLIGKIRENAAWRTVPIVMLSAKSQQQDIVRALGLGANDYVVKPFQLPEVLARIRRQLATQVALT